MPPETVKNTIGNKSQIPGEFFTESKQMLPDTDINPHFNS
jgi:hypothetical protein